MEKDRLLTSTPAPEAGSLAQLSEESSPAPSLDIDNSGSSLSTKGIPTAAEDEPVPGVWTVKPVPKGKRYGPFVGERKKRSQVKNNVYMWEVYFPNLGWMCIDATDPNKGNWLRYVNWAGSSEKQNLFPLEVNRAIYYKTFKPINPGEELLVWYNGEDNPEIAAAIEEERTSHQIKKNLAKAKKGGCYVFSNLFCWI
ncbi:PR domain zinc finger protein 2-like [Protopterus annectens]|uniref:PR domain zinc finger protein 2-like n=1 Tax=Protopterus annectens TaxID=7888 RepID=UPI001CFC2DC6|nr:PR domain zinc finger protein 2-like [Protopterus annectens]